VRERTEELEYAMNRAQAESRARGEHVAGMSHELRTSMNGLLGMLALMQGAPGDAEQREQMETARRCAASLLNLLNEVLTISELETNQARLEPASCDIRGLAAEVADSTRAKAAAKGLTLNLEVAPDVPSRLILDSQRVRQAISALTGIAVRSTSRGWVKLRVTRQASESGALIAIEVIDTSGGLAPNGTELSLSIARKLAAMHGGELAVERKEGIGSTCRLTLPCHLDSTPSSEVRPAEATLDAAAPILVVEDNYVNQKVVTGMLHKRGYEVEVANNGLEALQRLEARDYGLILMDVQMPVLDGFETTRRIRQHPRHRHIPIVAMTALALHGDRERCLEAGMDSYVPKPLNPIELLLVVEQQLMTSLSPVV
jgi:CheY-like chemotaxis protein